jgi:phosphohistidine phosphatase
MDIYFLRHGEAVRKEAWSGSDADRPLGAEGEARMERGAAALASLGVAPDALLASPLLRARQTAEIVARHVRPRVAVTVEARLAPGFGFEALGRIVSEHAGAATLLLVGHEPDFGKTVARCVGGGRLGLEPGGLAKVVFESPGTLSGTLAWLLPPDVLAP